MTGLVSLGVQLLAAAILMWACFCRLVKTDADTQREVRWSIHFLFVAAGIVLGAPFLPMLMPHEALWEPLTTPAWCWLLLLVATAIVHLVTARAWFDGAPIGLDRPRRAGASNALLPAFGLVLALFVASAPQQAGAAAEKLAQPEAGQDVYAMRPGTSVRCDNEGGCIIMTSEAASSLLAAAKAGVESTPCKRQSWL